MCFEIAIYIDSIHCGCILPAVYAAVEPYYTTVNALIDEFRKMKGPKISFCGISGIFVEHFLKESHGYVQKITANNKMEKVARYLKTHPQLAQRFTYRRIEEQSKPPVVIAYEGPHTIDSADMICYPENSGGWDLWPLALSLMDD